MTLVGFVLESVNIRVNPRSREFSHRLLIIAVLIGGDGHHHPGGIGQTTGIGNLVKEGVTADICGFRPDEGLSSTRGGFGMIQRV